MARGSRAGSGNSLFIKTGAADMKIVLCAYVGMLYVCSLMQAGGDAPAPPVEAVWNFHTTYAKNEGEKSKAKLFPQDICTIPIPYVRVVV